MRMLLLLAFTSLAAAVSLETQQVNGSLFYKATNNGGIEPTTWLNASSGNANIGNGQTQDIVLQRMSYYDMAVGAVYLNGGHPTWITLANGSLDGWNTYGYSDNSTSGYWRTESNQSFTFGQRTLTVRLKHAQQANDDLITIAIEANASGRINLPNTAWLAFALTNVTYLDTVNAWNDTGIYAVPVTANAVFDNWTFVTVNRFEAGWGWRFEDTDDEPKKLVVENGSVYLLWPLSNSIEGNHGQYLKAIDEGECGLSCTGSPPASVVIDFQFDGGSASQLTTENMSAAARWRVVSFGGGDCTISGCYLSCEARDPLTSGIAWRMIGLPGAGSTPLWFTLQPDNHTDDRTSNAARTALNPTKGRYYTFGVLRLGSFYRASGFLHRAKCSFNLASTGTPIDISGYDIHAPELNGCDFGNGAVLNLTTNNTILNVYSSNGSLPHVNVTPNCSFGTPNLYLQGQAYGLCANASMYVNNSPAGGWNLSATAALPWAYKTVQYDNLKNGTPYQLCMQANGTNTTSTGGYKDANASAAPWCYWFKLNIRPLPPGGGLPTPPAYHALGIEEDEYDRKMFPYGVLLLAGVIAVGFYVYFKT